MSPSDSLAKPLGDKFGADYEAFRAAALAVGAAREGLSPAGTKSFLFRDLPKAPARIEFYGDDEEFDSEIKTLFIANARIFALYERLEHLSALGRGTASSVGSRSDPEDREASFQRELSGFAEGFPWEEPREADCASEEPSERSRATCGSAKRA
ncbi:MAG: DUF3786 domain-containing protein [Deltaproteobacteria bacterium]|nr:DUF3786 domain-containing protein [Deltaproteobacteria bacterium]